VLTASARVEQLRFDGGILFCYVELWLGQRHCASAPFLFSMELRMSSLFASFTTGHTIVCDGGVLC
jgi:hypothetical protein